MSTDKEDLIPLFSIIAVTMALSFLAGFHAGRWSTGADHTECIEGKLYKRKNEHFLQDTGIQCVRLPLMEQQP